MVKTFKIYPNIKNVEYIVNLLSSCWCSRMLTSLFHHSLLLTTLSSAASDHIPLNVCEIPFSFGLWVKLSCICCSMLGLPHLTECLPVPFPLCKQQDFMALMAEKYPFVCIYTNFFYLSFSGQLN